MKRTYGILKFHPRFKRYRPYVSEGVPAKGEKQLWFTKERIRQRRWVYERVNCANSVRWIGCLRCLRCRRVDRFCQAPAYMLFLNEKIYDTSIEIRNEI